MDNMAPFPDFPSLFSQPPRHLLLLVHESLQVPVPSHLEELQEVHHHRFHPDHPHRLPGPLHLHLARSHQSKDCRGLIEEGGAPGPLLLIPSSSSSVNTCVRPLQALCRVLGRHRDGAWSQRAQNQSLWLKADQLFLEEMGKERSLPTPTPATTVTLTSFKPCFCPRAA